MRYFLGLDVAKDSFAAALLDEAGQVVSTASFANHLEGFSELLAWLPAPTQTIGVCEPTGVYNQHLKQTLATALESLHEINAQTLKQFAFSQVRTKTDQADALAIADAARTLRRWPARLHAPEAPTPAVPLASRSQSSAPPHSQIRRRQRGATLM